MTSTSCMALLTLLVLPLLASAAGAPAAKERDALKRELDRRPRADEKPFAPAHNRAVSVNPPAFVWLPLKRRPPYVLAVSRSAEFPKDASIAADAPISVHIPTEPFEPGRWHWRVGVRLADRSVAWSKTRAFTVPADAQPFPFPKMDAVVASIPREHPRLFFPAEALEQARASAQAGMKREFVSLLRRAQRAIGQDLVPEPPYRPRKRPEAGRMAIKIMRTTRPPMDDMERCALAYVLSGEKKFGLEAKRRLLHFFSWDPTKSTSLFSYDEPGMWVMQRGTRAYDWVHDLFTPAERAKVEPVMKVRYLQFLRRLTRMPFESRPYSSHPARDVGFLGEGAMCFIHEWPEARQWLEYCLKLYWSVFPAWAQEDGGWQEGPGYWGAYMSFALHFAAAFQKATGCRLTDKPFFRNTPYYKLYTNPPYARMSPFGDGQHGRAGRGDLMYAFSTLTRDPYIRWYADAQRSGPGAGPLGFALYDPSLKAKSPAELPQARAFDGAGLVAMHADLADVKGNAYLVMRSSPFGSISHGHADQNAFVIEAFGEALAIATGYYPWYSSPHHHNWTRQTKAKNAITIDGGKGQTARRRDASGRIVRFLHGKRFDYALGDATRAYRGALWRCLRHVVHIRPGVFVIVDELEAPKPVTFEWWLHAVSEMQVRPKTREILTRQGNARMLTTFVAPESLAFTQTDQFTPPPESSYKRRRPYANQWHLTASTRTKSKKAVFFTVLRPHRAAEEGKLPKLERQGNGRVLGVAWSAGGARYMVHLLDRGSAKSPIRTDARLLALRVERGKPAAWLATNATTLTYGAKKLFTSTQPTTATWWATEEGESLVTDGPATRIVILGKRTCDVERGRQTRTLR